MGDRLSGIRIGGIAGATIGILAFYFLYMKYSSVFLIKKALIDIAIFTFEYLILVILFVKVLDIIPGSLFLPISLSVFILTALFIVNKLR